MTVPLQEARNGLLERATAYVRSRLHGASAQTAESFLRAYWERVPAEDLVGRDPVDLAGAALAHLHLAERRSPGTARVRVYTPSFDDHGWASTHSVVEVVVDDMPFLLDSVSMELVRHVCWLHIVFNPVVPVTRDDDGPAELRRSSPRTVPLILTKAAARATVHRPAALDYVGVKRYDADGTLSGERRFLGLYTSTMHKAPTAEIPVLRRTVAEVKKRAGFAAASHDAKALAEVIEALPRLELLEVTPAELYDTALGILALQERQRVRLFVRRDRFGRHWSCFVYVPLDRYTQAVRHRITDILLTAFAGTGFEYSAQVGESVLARLHFVVHTEPGTRQNYLAPGSTSDLEAVEARIAQATRSWADDLSEALLEGYGEERGLALLRRYGAAFPAAYREDFPARAAVADIGRMESLAGPSTAGDTPAPPGIALSLAQPLEADGLLRFKLFAAGRPLPLSDVLPLLENMGVRVLDQRPYEVRLAANDEADDDVVWIHDFGLRPPEGGLEADGVKGIFTEAFAATWRGEAENDGFNRLVLAASLTGREVGVLRAYSKYLRQVGSAFSQSYMERTLAANPHIARLLVELFHARFDPARQPDPDDEASVLTKRLEASIDAVASLDEDRILRSFLALVQATLRTNWFRPPASRKAGRGHPVAFKLDPSQVPDLPRPRPATRSSCAPPGWRVCTCGAAGSAGAACGGPTGRRTSAPRSSAS